MATPQISLFIDVQNRQLVRSFTSTTPAVLPSVYKGDTPTLALQFLQATGVNAVPYSYIDYSSAAVTVSVGDIGARPTVGTFTITDTDASQTTAPLSYNATASQVQTAIQAALITNWNLASVYGYTGGPYTVTNGSNGSQTPLIGTSISLEPSSSVAINTQQQGTASVPQQEFIQLSVNPLALQTTWMATFSPDCLTGVLSFNTANVNQVLGNSPCLSTTFAIKVVPVSGSLFTIYQNNFTIRNDVSLGAPSAPAPSVTYYTTEESDARYRGQGVIVQRDSSGVTAQHVVTSTVGPNNVLYLLTGNTSGTVNFTFDNGTFDGQTITYRTDASLNTINYSANVAGVLAPDSIYGAGVSLSFMWDAGNSVWFPI